MTMTREGRRGNGVGPMPSTDCLSIRPLEVQGSQAGALRTIWASAERGQQNVWEAFGARAMKDADLEEQRACWDNRRTSQAGNAARTQQEYDDDESGATALMEGVGATAGGRFYRLHRGRKYGWDRNARQLTGGRIDAGRRQQNRRAISFLGPDTKAGGHWTREIGKKGQSRADLPSVGRISWTYVVAPVTFLDRRQGINMS